MDNCYNYLFNCEGVYNFKDYQDSFVNLQRYKHQYNPDKGKVRSYLFQIGYHLMVSRINRQKKWYNLLPFLSPIPKEEINHTDRMAIRDTEANLPDMHRALFYYFIIMI